MNWRNVQLIWRREMRDQLRDRRTLFVVAVLPMLMYPLLGTSFFQLAQFMKQSTGRVVVLGGEALAEDDTIPPLVDGERFSETLFANPGEARRLQVEIRPAPDGSAEEQRNRVQQIVSSGEADVAVLIPAGFSERLVELRRSLTKNEEPSPAEPAVASEILVLSDAARESSQVAEMRVFQVLRRWQDLVVRGNLAARSVPDAATRPFYVERVNVAPQERRDALLWSKLLPFIVFVWALTGAFYPAVDLCAGEKERGTLETLLSSPARRSEIVGGKLLTVMTFSVFTACLNLASLALTARVLVGQMSGLTAGLAPKLTPPPASAIFWLLIALLPIAALFSALSLAFASYARSMKEGQYYFMPLFLGAMPLMLVPMSPGVELNLGNSLVPIMGLVLLLRALIEGQGLSVLAYAVPVVVVTAVCCWLAVRWAISQFDQESILFHEGERFDPRRWFRSLVERREETPTPSAAMACVGAIFVLQFLSRIAIPYFQPAEPGLGYLAAVMLIGQIVCIAAPALFVASLLTTNWKRSLLIERRPTIGGLAMAAGLAIALRPVGDRLVAWIRELYPLSEELLAQLEGFGQLAGPAPPIWAVLLLFALLPAVCEEIAFRGVVLWGLRKSLGDNGGVLLTAVLFGATHTVLQQSLAAAPVGVVIGLVAIRTGSLVSCVVFHVIFNAMPLLLAFYSGPIARFSEVWGLDGLVFAEIAPGQLGYTPLIGILGAVVALALLRAMGGGNSGSPHSSARLGTASL